MAKGLLDEILTVGIELFKQVVEPTGSKKPEPKVARHRLLKAAQDYIDEVLRYEAACVEKGVYASADNAGVNYRRMGLNSKAFTRLKDLVQEGLAAESDDTISRQTVGDLITASLDIRKIALDPRSAIYMVAETHFRHLDQFVPRSDVKAKLSGLITLAEEYQKARQERADTKPASGEDISGIADGIDAIVRRMGRRTSSQPPRSEP